MDAEDEVLRLTKEILTELREDDKQEELSTMWRYFLTQTHDFKNILEKRLKRAEWPTVYEGVDGVRPLHITIAGICPSSCLMGFFVWLCESGHFTCEVVCSITDPALSSATQTVHLALKEQGWKVQLSMFDEHVRDLQVEGIGLDVVLVGHPEGVDTAWLSALHSLRKDGCVVLIDFPDSPSFAQTEVLDGIEYAEPVVMDRLPSGLDGFQELERSAICGFLAGDQTVGSELPVLRCESVSALFVNKNDIRTRNGSSGMSRTDSWAKSEIKNDISSNKQSRTQREVGWRGSWTMRIDAAAVPSAFVFALQAPTTNTTDNFSTYRTYYQSLQSFPSPSRIVLEGMGRPLLRQLYPQDNSDRCTSS